MHEEDIKNIPKERLPRHIAIIMDGNGRWAKRRGLPRIMGHRQGVKAVKEIVTAARQIGIAQLTLYAFSKENWNRPKDEVSTLMDILYNYLDRELATMLQNDIRLVTIGEIELIPEKARQKLLESIERTRNNRSMTLCLALSYGGRAEIVRAAQKIAQDILNKGLDSASIDETLFKQYLFTASMPDPDLIIRTSGEMRISNFLLYQGAYSELYFTGTLWPDFDKEEFIAAIKDYCGRQRRFGLTGEQIGKGGKAAL